MPKETRTRSSQFRRRRLIGVVFLSEARPFGGCLNSHNNGGVAIRNPIRSNLCGRFIRVLYHTPCEREVIKSPVDVPSVPRSRSQRKNSCNQLHSGARVSTLCSRGQSSRCQRALHSWAMSVGRDNRGQLGQHLKCLRFLCEKMQNVMGGKKPQWYA